MLFAPVDALMDAMMDAVLPGRCPGCGARATPLCAGCAARLRSAPPAPPPVGIDWWASCFAYEGVAREIIARAKYRGERVAMRGLARHLADAARGAPITVDVVTWAPASGTRRAHSGVDHGAVLARAVARALGVPMRPLLGRHPGPPQTGRDASSRRDGPRLRATGRPVGRVVLVVDDVATTGGTLRAAARVLRTSGARAVLAATLARTPPPGRVP